MTNKTKQVTSRHPFHSCTAEGDDLLAICEGVPLEQALERASSFLESAKGILCGAAEGGDSASVYGAAYLVDMAKAVVDSAAQSLQKGGLRS